MKSKKSYPGYLKGFLYYQVFFSKLRNVSVSAPNTTDDFLRWTLLANSMRISTGTTRDGVYVHVNNILAYELLVLRDK